MLEIRDLKKNYGKYQVLNGLDMTVPDGSLFGFVGPNGAGKTTTLKIMVGLLEADGGTVSYDGFSFQEAGWERHVGYVPDFFGVYDNLKVWEYMEFFASCYGLEGLKARKRCSALLEQIGLEDKEEFYVDGLSKGMKAKLSIAAALSHRPRLLILDEATSGLDPVMRDDILDVFLDFVQDEEHSILMSSHISADLEKVADYITFIHAGRVLFTRAKDELRYQWGVLRCGAALFGQLKPQEMLAWRREDYQWDVLVPDKEQARRAHPGAVVDDATIDEIMLLYVKGECVQ